MLRLLATGLLPPAGQVETISALGLVRLPRLLSRAAAVSSVGHWLTALPGYCGSRESVAAFWAQLDGLVGDEPHWLLVQPFHCLADHQGIYAQYQDLALSANEQTQIVQDLNAHLAQDGLCLYVGASGQWYLNLPARPKMHFSDWFHLPGQDLYHYLPQGEEQSYYRSLMTEIQMLLYRHPVNEARRNQARPEVASLWFWGHSPSPVASLDFDALVGDHTLLARLAASRRLPLLSLASKTLKGVNQPLVVLAGLQQLFWHDLAAWQQQVQQIERDWLRAPCILDTGVRAYELSAAADWAFWRSFAGWSAYLS